MCGNRRLYLCFILVVLRHKSPVNGKAMFGTTSTLSSQQVEIDTMQGVEGHSVELPCDLTPPNKNESVYLVLWYRQDEGGEPIYSYDARKGEPDKGHRWSDEERGFGKRANFQLHRHPSVLHIENIKAGEAGIYRCRVDFKTSPTRNSLLNLSVIIPPNKPAILDESGRETKDVIGPYLEGDNIILKCITSGGDPSPEVTWWRDSHLIDTSYETTLSGTVQNTLSVPQVNREDLDATLTCQASNNNLTTPATRKVTIDLKFRPETAQILNKKDPLSSGREYQLECKSKGSRPPATISWFKGNKLMAAPTSLPSSQSNLNLVSISKVLDKGNTTISTVGFKPSPSDHGKTIICRADNTELTNSWLEDSWKLVVHFAPIVALKLGANLNPDTIAEGNDVYFECEISANPEVYKIIWLHNDIIVQHEKTSGVIISGKSLVLQGITRKNAGFYACVASNTEGDTESNVIELKVMFKPFCGNMGRIVTGVGKGQSSEIFCPVIAHPPPTSFSWSFNNSQETIQISQDKYQSNLTHSRLLYQPSDDGDFGLIYCWASNSMGMMESPCSYQLIPAGPPDTPANCSVVNQTTDALEVQCLSGFDGGLQQIFVLEVFDLQTGALLTNATDKSPEFRISGLNSGRGLKITIYAVNSNGVSKSAVLEGFTLKVAELQLESPVPLIFTPYLGILIGVIFTLMIVAFVVLLVLRFKYKSGKPTNNSTRTGQISQNGGHSKTSNGQKATSRHKNISSANNDQISSLVVPTEKKSFDEDDEDFFCLHADNNQANKYLPRSDDNEINPDIITEAYMNDTQSRLLMRSATPVKSEASGSSVSGYGTADSGSCTSAQGRQCEKTPPYLPRNHGMNSSTLGRVQYPKHEAQRTQHPFEPVSYAQLTLPSPKSYSCQTSNFISYSSHSPSPESVNYSHLEPQIGSNLSRLISTSPLHPPCSNMRITMNPQDRISPNRAHFGQSTKSSPGKDVGSWTPLLSSRQQESTL